MRAEGLLNHEVRNSKIYYTIPLTTTTLSTTTTTPYKPLQENVPSGKGVGVVRGVIPVIYPDKPCVQCQTDEPVIDETTGAYQCSKCDRYYPQKAVKC